MIKNGRQAGTTLDQIREDHRKRYEFAISKATELGIHSIADVGCGTGYGSYMMAMAGFNVTAYEIDPGAIAYGEQYYSHPNLTRIQADIGQLDIPQVDMVTGFEIIEHTDLAPAFMKRASASHFVGSVPNELVIPFSQNRHWQHYRHYTPDEFYNELVDCGWCPVLFGQPGKRGADAEITYRTDNARTLIAYAYRSI